MCSNIPAKPTYGVYISQLIRICRMCDNYSSFLLRHKLLTERYGVSVRAHVTEGICIPLVAKPDLIRNVTICGCGRGRST